MAVFFLAYGVARQAILEPHAEASWTILRGVTYVPFFQIFGELKAEGFENKSK